MKKLFLHIGTWKTGSSTIQYNLYRLRKELEKEGYFFLCKENKMVINDGIIRNFTSIENDYVKKSREKFKEILDRKRSTNPDIDFISSAEEFSGNPFKGFKNAGAVAQNLFEITKGFGLDVNVIVYLRRQDDFFESFYQQSIRLGESHGFQDFLKKFDESDFNWYYIVRSYAELFGHENIIVRRYHNKFLPYENSLVQDFGKVIGSETISGFKSTTSRNRGYSRDILEITRIMNKYFDGEERFQLRKLYDKIDSKLPFEKYSYFTANQRRAFLRKYEDSNYLVAKEFLDVEEKNSLFPEPDYERSIEEFKGLSTESVVAHFSKAILLVKQEAEKENRNRVQGVKNKFFRFRVRRLLSKKLDRYPGFKRMIRRIIS
ncbi:MAG: hypothetical protein RI573_12025 [Balneolaceae bacterium]|nr:hypothetical protein [Balneolaceae bacterium]